MENATTRFSNRVKEYDLYRPGYPVEVISFLMQNGLIDSNSIVAEPGAGTGKLTAMLLPVVSKVYAIEPNAPMLDVCRAQLHLHPNLECIQATAEDTGLPDHGMDAILAAQAFHWFDKTATKAEFTRIGKAGCQVILLWNERIQAPGFMDEYDRFLVEHSNDYTEVDHRKTSYGIIAEFFRPSNMQFACLPNEQILDLKALVGRTLSCSYMPSAKDSRWPVIQKSLEELFTKYSRNDCVSLQYATKIYYGRFN